MRANKRIALLVVLVLLATACPSSNELDRAAKASNELAHDLVIANRVVGELFKAGKLSLAKKDELAHKLGVIGERANKLNDVLIELDKKYPQGTIPPQNAQFIRENWSAFMEIYREVISDLLPFGGEKAVKELAGDVKSIDKVVVKL